MDGGADPAQLFDALRAALEAHDVDALVDCFTDDYDSQQPVHPGRRFRGRDQVRRNWSGMFEEIPDFRAQLMTSAVADNVIWAEWHWTGTPRHGPVLDERGTSLFGVRAGRIAWGRLYIEPVEREAGDIEAQMRARLGETGR